MVDRRRVGHRRHPGPRRHLPHPLEARILCPESSGRPGRRLGPDGLGPFRESSVEREQLKTGNDVIETFDKFVPLKQVQVERPKRL